MTKNTKWSKTKYCDQ